MHIEYHSKTREVSAIYTNTRLVTMLRVLAVWLLVLCIPSSIEAADPATQPNQLVVSTLNPDWQISSNGSEVVFIGDSTKTSPILRLNRAQLLNGDVTLEVTTDAITCSISAADTKLELSLLRDKPNVLACTNGADVPSIAVNGAELTAIRGKWIAICRKTKMDTVSYSFVGATYVSLKVKGVENQARSSITATTRPATTEQSTAKSAPQMIAQVQTGVFAISVKNTHRAGTGILLNKDGFAATNIHVIRGATEAVGVFLDDTSKEIPLELWAVLPGFDLALIKLDWSQNRSLAEKVTPLEIEKNGGKVGEEVWALGYPEMGFTATRGIISGIRSCKELPAEIQKGFSASSEWIQTDCTINHGNSGGPLLNANGRIIGINTWSMSGGNNLYLALSARHLQDLYDQRSKTALTFKESIKTIGEEEEPQGSFPITSIKADKDPSEILPKIRILIENSKCSLCQGKGFITRRVQTGTYLF